MCPRISDSWPRLFIIASASASTAGIVVSVSMRVQGLSRREFAPYGRHGRPYLNCGQEAQAMLHEQLPWYIAGPVLGLCVVAVRALSSARLGVAGGFSEIVGQVGAQGVSFDWLGWLAIGIHLAG